MNSHEETSMSTERDHLPILGAALAALLLAAVPLDAQQQPVRQPAVRAEEQLQPGDPCCGVTAIDMRSGLVTAKDARTGQSFRFRVTDRALLRSIEVGQSVYATDDPGRVGIRRAPSDDGHKDEIEILSVISSEAQAADAAPSGTS